MLTTRRAQPLTRPLAGWSVVVTFVLIGIALLATVWTTRGSVIEASDAVQRGQALAIEQAVRADLANLEGPPTPEDLAAILADHRDDGLRYIARVDKSGLVGQAGTPLGVGGGELPANRGNRMPEVGGRLRLQVRPFRRLRDGGRQWRAIVEVEPVQARELREAATLTLGIGAIAAGFLLTVAIFLVRRESLRVREERERERERRLASLGEMSAVLAHEIKNPLASLKGNAQLLKAMLAAAGDQPLGDKPKAKAERVVDEALRLEALVQDLLEFVRTGEIHRLKIDPANVVREAALSASPTCEVVTEGAPRTWALDAGRIREVVVNLVENAMHAGPPVRVAVRAEHRRLVIEVADHGPGIPEDEREKVFEPFFTAKTQGTGLGLAVVRRVIEQHGGTITVLAAPGGGALFRAEIPES